MADDYDLQEDLSKSILEFTYRQHEHFSQSLNDDEPLPATYSELIIMALVYMQHPASAEEINLWITRLLGADYREHRRPGSREYPAKTLMTVVRLLTSAFDLPVEEVPPESRMDAYDRPPQTPSESGLQRPRDQNVLEHIFRMTVMGSAPLAVSDRRLPRPMRWTAPIREAAPFLRRRLFSPWSPDKHFPIVRLPVELREYIFTYALALPPGACMRTKEPRRNSSGERWEISTPRWHSSSRQYEVDPDFLALFRVSKSFYREASPCFWSQGILVSGSASKICHLLRPAAAWQYVEQLDLKLRDDDVWRMVERPYRSFDGGDDDDEEIPLLASMPRLRKLIVRLTPLRAYGSKEGMLNLPSVVSLRRHVRGLKELVVHGPLQHCEDVLRADLVGPRKVSGRLECRDWFEGR
ncbi:hypothetical protein Q7P35_001098 [Cladosporium inversicolor]